MTSCQGVEASSKNTPAPTPEERDRRGSMSIDLKLGSSLCQVVFNQFPSRLTEAQSLKLTRENDFVIEGAGLICECRNNNLVGVPGFLDKGVHFYPF